MTKTILQMEPIYGEEEKEALIKYLDSKSWLTEHLETEKFASAITQYTGSSHCVVTCNGTISLTLALWALGIGPGDEVIVPNLTMIASPNSVKMTGAKPVLADVNESTLCLSLAAVEEKITPKTKAIMYVAFNGRSDNMKKVVEFAKSHNLYLVEDAAQSLGSFCDNQHLGTFGEIGSFSFSTPKIITTGQGGALVTKDEQLYKKMKLLKDFGRTRGGNDIHDTLGYNFKFTDLQAVIGIAQMKKLDFRVKRKKEMFKRYFENLVTCSSVQFIDTNIDNTTPWFMDIFVDSPEKLAAGLKEKGILTRCIYPPIHQQKAYDVSGSFPITEKYSARGLWLPSAINLTNEDIDYICDSIITFYRAKR